MPPSSSMPRSKCLSQRQDLHGTRLIFPSPTRRPTYHSPRQSLELWVLRFEGAPQFSCGLAGRSYWQVAPREGICALSPVSASGARHPVADKTLGSILRVVFMDWGMGIEIGVWRSWDPNSLLESSGFGAQGLGVGWCRSYPHSLLESLASRSRFHALTLSCAPQHTQIRAAGHQADARPENCGLGATLPFPGAQRWWWRWCGTRCLALFGRGDEGLRGTRYQSLPAAHVKNDEGSRCILVVHPGHGAAPLLCKQWCGARSTPGERHVCMVVLRVKRSKMARSFSCHNAVNGDFVLTCPAMSLSCILMEHSGRRSILRAKSTPIVDS